MKRISARQIGLLFGPALFAVALIILPNYMEDNPARVMAMAAWMITWWVTEAVPIPVTALLPIILLPILGVSTIPEATTPYASQIIFLFMGGFMIALGLEKHNLHKRLALNLLRLTGTSGNGIIMGFMISTALLSMWISNTATAVMMLPIALSVSNLVLSASHQDKKSSRNFALGLMLSIAYAANIGGTMTLIGTPPNVVMAGTLRSLADIDISFNKYLLVGLPVGTTLLTLTYFLLVKVLFPNKLVLADSHKLVKNQLDSLGPLRKKESLVILVFTITVIGWVLKSQINNIIGSPLLTDPITAMIGGCLMFTVPTDLRTGKRLLDWKDAEKLPWGILLLFGGGLSLAKAMEKTGIILMIGDYVTQQGSTSLIVLVPVMTIIVLFMTEVMSNVALITIFIPVAIGICQGLNIDPLLVVVPATLASSCAFMMPISTPPNAIVFASGHIKIKDMMKAGVWLNLIAGVLLALAGLTLVKWVFIN